MIKKRLLRVVILSAVIVGATGTLMSTQASGHVPLAQAAAAMPLDIGCPQVGGTDITPEASDNNADEQASLCINGSTAYAVMYCGVACHNGGSARLWEWNGSSWSQTTATACCDGAYAFASRSIVKGHLYHVELVSNSTNTGSYRG